jgi:short-subunit dehydrogenase
MAAPIALITGASEGIGLELARIFAAEGHRVALVARREELLRKIAEELVLNGVEPPLVIACDLAQENAGETIAAALRAADVEPEFVVNNAGYGLFGEADAIPIASQRDMIAVNIAALTDLSVRFSESLARRRGGILNVGSVAGFVPGPRMAAYYATKAYVLSFSEALYEEMRARGVRVTLLAPGPVETGFQRRAGYRPGGHSPAMAQSARDVALAGYRGLMAGQRLVVPSFLNRVITVLVRLLPRGAVVTLMGVVQRRRS